MGKRSIVTTFAAAATAMAAAFAVTGGSATMAHATAAAPQITRVSGTGLDPAALTLRPGLHFASPMMPGPVIPDLLALRLNLASELAAREHYAEQMALARARARARRVAAAHRRALAAAHAVAVARARLHYPVAAATGSWQQITADLAGPQAGCLDNIIERESGGRVDATNPSTGAYGIPQALPGSKMASAGADWQTNPDTQIRWMIHYTEIEYGGPCGAWNHWQAVGSY